MIRGSIWWPTDPKRAALALTIPLLFVLHQSELFGMMDATTLVFGWLPPQLAWDVGVTLVGVVVAYAFYTQVPEPDVQAVGAEGSAAGAAGAEEVRTESGGDDGDDGGEP